MLKIILIRHGEEEKVKEGNIEYQSNDSELTKEGIEQVEKLAEILKNLNIDEIYSSDIIRAMQTAEIINKKINKKIIIDTRLRERNIGDFEKFGDDWRKEFKRFKEKELAKGIPSGEIKPQNGESLHEFRERIKSFLRDLSKKEGNILLSAHKGTNTAIINFALDWDCREFKPIEQNHACMNILSFEEGKWNVLTINKNEI
jgi:broad specificity phosphatase PhoE